MSYKRGHKYAKTYSGSEPGFTGIAYTTFGVLYKSKRNRLKNFVHLGDEEYKGDGDNARIGEETERKRVDAITVTSQISFHNTDNEAHQEASHAIFAKRSEKTCRGKRLSHGRPIQGDEPFDEEDTPSDDVESQHLANSLGFVKREHHSWSYESLDDYMVMAI